jgi:hypothetical protein
VLVVRVTSWSGEGVRDQVSGDDVRSYEGLTYVTVALLSLLLSQGEGHKGEVKKELQCLAAGTSRPMSPSTRVH